MSIARRQVASISYSDPAGDENIHVLRAPADDSITVEAAYAVSLDGFAGSTANYVEVALMNGGSSGTATTVISGTAGGTGGWTADSPQSISITDGSGKLESGEYLVIKHDETGSVDASEWAVFVEYVHGVGSTASA